MNVADCQDQRSGDESVNIQAGGNVTFGPSIAEVREIAQLTYDANILRLQGIARDEVDARAAELRAEFIDRLASERPQDASKAADPDFQFALFDAQRSYARTGEPELRDLLVDMLVDRVGRGERSLLHIVLGESLIVAPKLTPPLFDALTVVFLLRYTRNNGIVDLRTLQELLIHNVAPFLDIWPPTDSSFEHLQYAACGVIEIGQVDLPRVFREMYPEVFPPPQNDPAVEAALRAGDARLSVLVDTWMTSTAKNFTLTTVGKAIAHANLRRKTGDKSDLAVWIN